MYIAPELGAEWLFDAARAYWDVFRPTIITDFELVTYVPSTAAVIVTVIARRDTVETLGVELSQMAARAFFDPVAFDLFDEMKLALNNRTQLYQPFGVPLEPTTLPGDRVERTPGSVFQAPPTRAPGGFITMTPTPNAPAAVPTQPPQNADTPPPAVEPTPGSLIGG
jgi:hypothetical protein